MAQLVEHDFEPLFVGHDIGEHPDITGTIEVRAECVLVFSGAGKEIAAIEDAMDVESERVERESGAIDNIDAVEDVGQINGVSRWGVLKKRVVIVPWGQGVNRAGKARRELDIERCLPGGKRDGGNLVDLLECCEEPVLVEFVGRQRHREVITMSKRSGGTVAEASECANVVGHDGADLFGRFPRPTPKVDIIAVAQDGCDVVVADASPVELCAKGTERRVDRRRASDEFPAKLGIELVSTELMVQQFKAANEEGVVGRRACRAECRGSVEFACVGKRVAQGEFGISATQLCRRRRVRAGLPPRVVEFELEWFEATFELDDEIAQCRHHSRAWSALMSFIPLALCALRAWVAGSSTRRTSTRTSSVHAVPLEKTTPSSGGTSA